MWINSKTIKRNQYVKLTIDTYTNVLGEPFYNPCPDDFIWDWEIKIDSTDNAREYYFRLEFNIFGEYKFEFFVLNPRETITLLALLDDLKPELQEKILFNLELFT